MTAVNIVWNEEAGNTECCCCRQEIQLRKGPGWKAPEAGQFLCRQCVESQVPSLVALLDLALAAEKVGKQCRHLLTPPMESLLDLARAAENYAETMAWKKP